MVRAKITKSPRGPTVFVAVELGHGFDALPPDTQSQVIERELANSMTLLQRQLDDARSAA